MNSGEVKQVAYDLGADLCGIASVDRFEEAPEGFHPRDVLPSCQSVVVFARRFSVATLHCKAKVPYTITRNVLSRDLDTLAVRFCDAMEERGILAVPTGTIGPNSRDERTGRWRNVVSSKHSAVAAGLGQIGRNTLLVTPEYGNMVWIHAVLMDAVLQADPVLEGSPCPPGCTLCIDRCPAHALGNMEMDQQACQAYAFHTEPGEAFVFKCHACRTLCPNCFGSKNRHLRPKE